jgi:hypothetical protein
VSLEEIHKLCQMRLEYLTPVTEPLVLISQISRSGGTLLSQLFDMHPQCHAHPPELKIGYPHKWTWPPLDLNDTPDGWFRTLFEPTVLKHVRRGGYEKHGTGADDDLPTHPFLFLPSLQKAIFDHCIASQPVRSPRDILNSYMTSYFNAWLDNQNLYAGPKKFITAFVPRMSRNPDNLQKFFAAYPDGRLIAIVREPKSWYFSASPDATGALRPRHPRKAIAVWLSSTRAIIQAKETYGPRVRILSFEALLGDTAATMRGLAEWLEIEYTPHMTRPTFNGLPILANSSFKVRSHGVIGEPLHRHRELSDEDGRYIDQVTAEVLWATKRVMS